MTTQQQIILRKDGTTDHAAYLELWAHPHDPEKSLGIVKKSIDLHALIHGYVGPRLTLDLNENNEPIGLEILYPYGKNYVDP